MKLAVFGEAVNVSLGLPIVRTSVDHGTAYDRAGTWTADARGMRAAIALAVRLARLSRGARPAGVPYGWQLVDDERKVPQGRLGRLARLGRHGRQDRRRRPPRPERHGKRADHAAEVLGTLRGLAAKVGQMASYVDGIVPEGQRAGVRSVDEGPASRGAEVVARGDPRVRRGGARRAHRSPLRPLERRAPRERVDRPGPRRAAGRRARGRGEGAAPGRRPGGRERPRERRHPRGLRRRARRQALRDQEDVRGHPRAVPRGARLRARGEAPLALRGAARGRSDRARPGRSSGRTARGASSRRSSRADRPSTRRAPRRSTRAARGPRRCGASSSRARSGARCSTPTLTRATTSFTPTGVVTFLDYGCIQEVEQDHRARAENVHRAALARDEQTLRAGRRGAREVEAGRPREARGRATRDSASSRSFSRRTTSAEATRRAWSTG